jgi:hypothetical protein
MELVATMKVHLVALATPVLLEMAFHVPTSTNVPLVPTTVT